MEKGYVYIDEEVEKTDLETESRELLVQLQYDVCSSIDMLDSECEYGYYI